ncbi:hypothetical protein KHF85_05340 [Xanthomonas translucens pv. graminis]|uniref:hypothetical protein n=1 Tax=Xanthomonas graminis TaxID=3390026 RepID=UPI002540832D|nr:hypothetical protein [Xanthomonas translucens]WIH05888.1 hypothetical protein KHF85_05340 [Xanthomonas translucens pv. graminis]
MKPWRITVQIAGILFAAGACSMAEAAPKTPMASDVLALPADQPTQRLFDCAETSIAHLSETSSSWPKVTRKDAANGVLESGNFEDANRSGFRIRIERAQGVGQAKIALKGAGAYFADLGVAQAMQDLKTALGSCIATPPR